MILGYKPHWSAKRKKSCEKWLLGVVLKKSFPTQNSHRNTCARVSVYSLQTCNFIKERPVHWGNTFSELLLFIDSLFAETATSFPITNFGNTIFVCKSCRDIECFKKLFLKFRSIQKVHSWRFCAQTINVSEVLPWQIFRWIIVFAVLL